MSATNVDQMLRFKGFDVEIEGVDGASTQVDSSWTTVSGGVLVERVDASSHKPGNAPQEEIVLRGLVTPERESLARWLTDTQTGGNPYRTVTITLIPRDNDDKARETIIFYDAFLTAYTFPHLDLSDPCPGPLVEEIRFSFGRWIRLPI